MTWSDFKNSIKEITTFIQLLKLVILKEEYLNNKHTLFMIICNTGNVCQNGICMKI